MPMSMRFAALIVLAGSLVLPSTAVSLQDVNPPKPLADRIEVVPDEVTLDVGQTVQLKAAVLDAQGATMDEPVFFFSRSRTGLSVDAEGLVKALAPGDHRVVLRTRRKEGHRVQATVQVHVREPALDGIVLEQDLAKIYAGTRRQLDPKAVDVLGGERVEPQFIFASTAPDVASLTPWGELQAHSAGKATLSMALDEQSLEVEIEVLANPVRSLRFASMPESARTGDVLRFTATARDADGSPVNDAPVEYSVHSKPDDNLGSAAGAQVMPDGRFVAEVPGIHTVVATCGEASVSHAMRISPRQAQGQFELVGRGPVLDVHTSDLWVWSGAEGRDWCVTGTWGANGEAHFWDVTDPTQPERVASVKVDARTVNDVKVSENGKLCVLSREGASNRKNGLVLVDVSDPREPRILAEYDEGLTGGVHNVFVDGNHVYALSAGRRFDVIDVSDPLTPQTVGSFELGTPGHSIHDVWVVDGVAYSSNWSDGVQMIDVGGGNMGGSPSNPVAMASYTYPSGWNHAAWPYQDPETGRFYIIAGDEAFPYGLNVTGRPTYPRGWIHFIDFSDPNKPVEVARYQVPEAGTHNLWVEDDVLYVAYYNGGVRAVDISGELLGDLYRQGREIAWYLPTDPEGVVANAPMVWGPQPHKGNLFISDWNSGLWVLKLLRGQG